MVVGMVVKLVTYLVAKKVEKLDSVWVDLKAELSVDLLVGKLGNKLVG